MAWSGRCFVLTADAPGVTVDGVALAPNAALPLASGARLDLGETRLVFWLPTGGAEGVDGLAVPAPSRATEDLLLGALRLATGDADLTKYFGLNYDADV